MIQYVVPWCCCFRWCHQGTSPGSSQWLARTHGFQPTLLATFFFGQKNMQKTNHRKAMVNDIGLNKKCWRNLGTFVFWKITFKWYPCNFKPKNFLQELRHLKPRWPLWEGCAMRFLLKPPPSCVSVLQNSTKFPSRMFPPQSALWPNLLGVHFPGGAWKGHPMDVSMSFRRFSSIYIIYIYYIYIYILNI